MNIGGTEWIVGERVLVTDPVGRYYGGEFYARVMPRPHNASNPEGTLWVVTDEGWSVMVALGRTRVLKAPEDQGTLFGPLAPASYVPR